MPEPGVRANGFFWFSCCCASITGARLGEVLALDERRDIDFLRGVVIIPDGSEKREVPLPKEVIARVRSYCVRYDVGSDQSGERIFDLDQGFIRPQILRAVRNAAVFPKPFSIPGYLRNSRAIELLQGGMPMRRCRCCWGIPKPTTRHPT